MNRPFKYSLRITVFSLLMLPGLSLYAAEVRQPTPERVLRFSEDYSIGGIYIEDESVSHSIEHGKHFTYHFEWKYLAEARGEVAIPAGHRVKLELTWQVWENPERAKDLEKLAPDAIYTLTTKPNRDGYIAPEDAIPSDWLVPHIASLTGLKELFFFSVKISGKALSPIRQCTELEHFRTPEYCTNSGLKTVTDIKTLKRLSISAGQMSDKAISLIKKLGKLEELSISGPGLTDAVLPEIAALPKLRYLYLKGDYSEGAMAHLKKCTNLKGLSLFDKHYGDKAVRHISQIPNLERFKAHWAQDITDKGVSYLKNIPNLKLIDIGSAKLTDVSAKTLGQISSLEYLMLGSDFTDTGIEHLAQLTNLKFLWVDCSTNSMLSDRSMKAVSQLSQLEELHIGGTGITDEGVACLAKLKNLRRLGFSWVSITDESLTTIGSLTNLKYLHLDPEQPFSTNGLNQLGGLINLEMFTCNKIKNGNSVLDLSGLKNLEHLWLISGSDSKKNIQYPPLENDNFLFLKNLYRLDTFHMNRVKLDRSGLAAMAGMKNLRHLYIGGPLNITDADMTVFAADSPIESIGLKDGHFTGDCLEHLATMKNLQRLDLTSDMAFDEKAIQAFKQKKKLRSLQLIP